jgi:hypothetical protein
MSSYSNIMSIVRLHAPRLPMDFGVGVDFSGDCVNEVDVLSESVTIEKFKNIMKDLCIHMQSRSLKKDYISQLMKMLAEAQDPEPQSEPQSESEHEPQSESEHEPQSESEPVTMTMTMTKTKPVTKSVTKSVTKPVTKSVTKSVTKPVTKSVTKPVTQSELESEPESEPESESDFEGVLLMMINQAIEINAKQGKMLLQMAALMGSHNRRME